MTSKLYNGSAWKNLNGLKLYNGTTWKNAVRGWMWSGSAWKQWYPEYPINTAAPSVSGSTTQGNTLSTTNGSWNSNLAYSPASYTYQWRRGSSDISGATNSTYVTQVADVGNAISCRVTAANNRGSTPVISSNSITITSALPGAPSALTLTNNMATPNAPASITVSNLTQTSFSVSWGLASGTFQAYEVLTSNSNHVVSNLNQTSRTATVSGGSAGESYYVAAFATNTSGSMVLNWNAGSNATSYDIHVNGSYLTNTANLTYTYNPGTVGAFSITIYSRNSSGRENTGVTQSITLSKVYSTGRAASGNFLPIYPTFTSGPSASSITTSSATISWSATNQSSYSVSISGIGTLNGTTGTSVNFTGLSHSTSYTAIVTLTSSTGGQTQAQVSFTTAALVITPSINSFYADFSSSTSSTVSLYVYWSATNQASYYLSSSPSLSNLPASGTSSTTDNRYVGIATRGTTYSITLTVTSSTGHSTSQTINYTPPSSGGTAPSTPTGLFNSYSSGPSWTGTWTASTGTAPITYYWTLYQSQSSGGSISAQQSGSTTGTSFTQSMNSAFGLWAYFTVYAQNSVGTSGTATSNWA